MAFNFLNRKQSKKQMLPKELVKKSVFVIGAINIDIIGVTTILNRNDSNTGKISIIPGGVGRNIVENLARIGVPVKFSSVVGDDRYGEIAIKNFIDLGVDVNLIKRVADRRTSLFISVSSVNISENYTINDMEIMNLLDRNWIYRLEDSIKSSDYVLIDCNIGHDALEAMISIEGIKLIVVPATISRVKLILPFLSFIHTILLTKYEMDVITGVKTRTEQDALDGILSLHDKGIEYVILKYDESIFYTSNGFKIKKIVLKNLNAIGSIGARSAFSAGFVSYLCMDKSFDEALQAGIAAYVRNVETSTVVSFDITYDNLLTWIENLEYDEMDISF